LADQGGVPKLRIMMQMESYNRGWTVKMELGFLITNKYKNFQNISLENRLTLSQITSTVLAMSM
jgi:hypothetical protein